MANIRDLNRLANVYRREANKLGIGSPYRIDEYIRFRMVGMSKAKAIEKVKSKEHK